MAKTVEAIFENGVFKPLEKVIIKEHEKVTVILPYPGVDQTKECNLHGIIDIAKGCSDTDLSIQHDNYLYGEGID